MNQEQKKDSESQTELENNTEKTGALATVFNVLSAAFGVRSSKRRGQDFTQGKFHTFAITAIGFVIIFIFTVFSVVKFVLSQAS
ncbi:DUF2970 domain-containing protein [Spongiibacter sp. KMU-158]|uniref:DUF2970 domain-containing protein n=1 Tax=Spongiibacter pelagi TaxID=2760804 RepID=A0A927GWW9_9GAMM|nr:DUF2970 domain-containing protein [Spongiibacter pelagi]MBD2859910.1 DUF2970 domain-containing protein [Spongiibacter pelagi]